jgi:hypothetical protein
MIIDASLHKTEEADYLAISRERYQTQLDQLVDLEIIPPGKVTVDQVMSTSYAPN